MSKRSKRMKAAYHMQENEELFRCPIFSSSIKVVHQKSIVCLNNHTFDLSRQGYVHLIANESISLSKQEAAPPLLNSIS